MDKIKKLFFLLSKKNKRNLALTLVLMVFSSFTEVVSLGVLIPFLGVLTSPEIVYQHAYIQPIILFFNISSAKDMLLPISVLFSAAILISGVVKLGLLYLMNKVSYSIGSELSITIFGNILNKDYSFHMSQNSSRLIDIIVSKTSIVSNSIIKPLLTFISACILLLAIGTSLLFINYKIALVTFVSLAVIYLSIVIRTKARVHTNSYTIAEKSANRLKILQEGLGGIRDILLSDNRGFQIKQYLKFEIPLRDALFSNAFIAGSPRFAMETLGMIVIVFVAYFSSLYLDLKILVPVLGVFILGAQKALPAFQQMFSSYSAIKGGYASLHEVFELLNSKSTISDEALFVKKIPFNREIELNNISFKYEKDGKEIFKNLSLHIKKGSRVGFIGVTGSGKSTLIDIIMGLLSPTSGEILIDGQKITKNNSQSWQQNISHVPQNIFLSDDTIQGNVAFGVPEDEIDIKRVIKAVDCAYLTSFVSSLKKGFLTNVGEQGVRLSGGQRQRIGIARALYRSTSVLVLDEATSSLDSETESCIMKGIEDLDSSITILIIAHRLNTLANCDIIFKFEKNGSFCILDYKDIVSSNKELANKALL